MEGEAQENKIFVIGMEGDGIDRLTPESQRRIAAADLLMGESGISPVSPALRRSGSSSDQT
ncbi:MAG: hypothetical protein MPW17_21550 (plasmid) [Candidatus Manganitrophus sp.]|nr:MAG: hypothetical protein MPW17_21550 [Candidatus Manganitrophus sp.]